MLNLLQQFDTKTIAQSKKKGQERSYFKFYVETYVLI